MIKTAKELAAACLNVARNHKTLYVLGAFGWPMTAEKKQRAKNAQSYNRKPERAAKIDTASADTFGFDCVCFIKALLWGWNGDASAGYGGAMYSSNGVLDIGEGEMISACTEVSTDFSKIAVGEAVWLPGHIGIYVGDGLAVECTPIWKDGVQITAVHNIGTKAGYKGRFWTKHGKLPYVTYEEELPEEVPAEKSAEEKGDYIVEMRILREGCKGEDVRALQILLIGRGFSCGKHGADGDFGADTKKAVKEYQKKIFPTAPAEWDGEAGPKTMGRLLGL